jgi:formylglycine-generating enzyme required for sulfatase activity
MLLLARSVDDAVTKAEAIGSLAAYAKDAPAMKSALKDVAQRLEGTSQAEELGARVQRAQRRLEDWARGEQRVASLSMALVGGDLAAAVKAADAWRGGELGRAEFDAVGEVARGCGAVFARLLEDLDCELARESLDELARQAERLDFGAKESVRRVKRWAKAVDDLRDRAIGMVKIEAGTTRVGKCAAFFIAPTETTSRRFEEFRAKASELGLEELAARLGAASPPAAELQRLLRAPLRQGDEMPADGVTQYAAAACAAFYERALPTHAEWALAAFGDKHTHEYPWGGSERRSMSKSLEGAETDGDSWRNGATPRHLAGNVAEWLAAEQAAATAALAGGSYRDVPRDQDRRAKGELQKNVPRAKALSGYGFREVLRPGDILARHFKDGRFPSLSR